MLIQTSILSQSQEHMLVPLKTEVIPFMFPLRLGSVTKMVNFWITYKTINYSTWLTEYNIKFLLSEIKYKSLECIFSWF